MIWNGWFIYAPAVLAIAHILQAQLAYLYAPEKLQIYIRTEICDSNQIKICIADNGIGISDSTKPYVFDPFFTTKQVGQDTGLGLSISYQIIVDKHQGQLECQSIPGEGAEFIIALPLRRQRFKVFGTI